MDIVIMKNYFIEYKSIRIYLWIALISSFLISFTVLFGWITNTEQLVHFDPTAPPMQPNTAILFLCCAIAILSLLKSWRFLAIAASICVLLMSGLTLAEYIFHVDLRIDQLFVKNDLVFKSPFPGRPGPNTVACFFLLGMSLFASCFPYKKKRSFLITFFCGVSASISIIALFGYILGFYSIIGWYSYVGMALFTSIGILILSTCIFLTHSFLAMYKDKSFYGALMGGVFVIIYLTFTLWEGFQTTQHLTIQKTSQNSADFIALSVNSNLNDTAKALRRMALRWQIVGYNQAQWDIDSKYHVEDITGLKNLSFYDQDQRLIYSRITDKDANSPSLSLTMKAMLEEPTDEIGHSLFGNFLSLILPVFSKDGKIEGFLVGVIEMKDVVDNSIPKFFEERSVIEVLDENRSAAETSLANTHDWAIATIESPYIDWLVKVYPKESAITTNYLPHLILITGAIFAAYMIWIVSLLQNLFRAKERILRLMKDKSYSSAYRQAILNSSNYSIIATDPNGLILLYNKAAEKMLLWKSSEVLNKLTPLVFLDPKEVEERAKQLTELLGEKINPGFETFVAMAKLDKSDEHEWTYIRKDGTKFPVQLSIAAVKDRHAKLIGYVGIAYDLTELKEVERMKKELIAITTHEIRSPLTSIKGALDLISVAETIHPKDNQLFKIAHSNCNRILNLTNDILDIQKMESGKMEYFPKKVLVETLFEKVIEINQVFASSRGVKLIKPNHVPACTIFVDEDRILQVLTNFISNAIKNSPKDGMVTFEATIHDDIVRIGVRDQGSGIPKEFQGLLFQKFSQIPSENKAREGTGLGLTICKSIIKEHAGTIGFDTSSEGSVFWFELPIHSEKANSPRTTEVMEKKK